VGKYESAKVGNLQPAPSHLLTFALSHRSGGAAADNFFTNGRGLFDGEARALKKIGVSAGALEAQFVL